MTRRISGSGHKAPAMMPVRSGRGVESSEVGMLELGEEHRRHAVERGALLAIDDFEDARGIEEFERTQTGAVRVGREDAEHAAEAMKQRHAQAESIRRRVAEPLADPVAVVDDVAAREHDALGEAGRARRVLHVDHVVYADGCLALDRASASDTWRATLRSCEYGVASAGHGSTFALCATVDKSLMKNRFLTPGFASRISAM